MPIDPRDLTPETEALRQRVLAALDYEAPDDPHDGPPWRRPWTEPSFDRSAHFARIAKTLADVTDEDERTRVSPMSGYSVAKYKRWITAPPTLDPKRDKGGIDPHAVIAAARRIGPAEEDAEVRKTLDREIKLAKLGACLAGRRYNDE